LGGLHRRSEHVAQHEDIIHPNAEGLVIALLDLEPEFRHLVPIEGIGILDALLRIPEDALAAELGQGNADQPPFVGDAAEIVEGHAHHGLLAVAVLIIDQGHPGGFAALRALHPELQGAAGIIGREIVEQVV